MPVPKHCSFKRRYAKSHAQYLRAHRRAWGRAVVQYGPRALTIAPEWLRKHTAIMQWIVRKSPHALKYAAVNVRSNRTVVMDAIEREMDTWVYCDDWMMDDPEMYDMFTTQYLECEPADRFGDEELTDLAANTVCTVLRITMALSGRAACSGQPVATQQPAWRLAWNSAWSDQ
mmetsp:Transcript_75063/g.140036  ORF Transcript_75063/g.140036 Transcript_75063/m.140036 type:complete len:173 (-) Transcript_75063:32-550(-)